MNMGYVKAMENSLKLGKIVIFEPIDRYQFKPIICIVIGLI